MAKTIAEQRELVREAEVTFIEVSNRTPRSPQWMLDELHDRWSELLDELWKMEDYENDPF